MPMTQGAAFGHRRGSGKFLRFQLTVASKSLKKSRRAQTGPRESFDRRVASQRAENQVLLESLPTTSWSVCLVAADVCCSIGRCAAACRLVQHEGHRT